MKEEKMSAIFEPSYTLDVLNFLDHLFTPRSLPNEPMVCHFEAYLGDYNEKILQTIRKKLVKFESISEVLTPLIIADPEFNDLKLSELLASPKYLINQYKNTSSYVGASKAYRKFLKNDSESMMIQVGCLIKELERAKFKTYWLQSCLPLVNQQIKSYKTDIWSLSIPEKLGNKEQCIYVLSCIDSERVQLTHQKLIVSHLSSSRYLIYNWIESFLTMKCPLMKLRSYEQSVKKNKELKLAYKKVKDQHRSLVDYIEANIKLAMTVYLSHEWGILEQPYEYLKRYEFGNYELSLLFYQALEQTPQHQMTITQWLQQLLEEVDLSAYQQQVGIIAKQHG